MTIADIFAEQVRIRADAVALIDARGGKARRLTYRELRDEVAAMAGWFETLGLRQGQAVLVFVPMGLELYVALLALFRIGATALFLDPSAGPAHIDRCCALLPPDGLLAVPKAHLLRLKSGALRKIPLKLAVSGWFPGAKSWRIGGAVTDRAPREANLPPSHPALVTFTSGSTGAPKAVVRSHGFLAAQHAVLAPELDLRPGEVDLATLPIFALASLASGVATVIPDFDLRRPGAVNAERIVREIHRHGVSRITASPAFFERLIERAEPLPTVRKLHTGGAPVFPRVLAGLRRIAPQAKVVAVYGSTEAEPIAELDAEEISTADEAAMATGGGLLAGRPVHAIRLRILRDRWGEPRGSLSEEDLERETQPAETPGEIVVAGEHVLDGYLGGVGDAETKFSVAGEIWHRTGDAGRLDADGRLWLLGRCAARIHDAHGELYPFAVECVAMTFPDVRRAALVSHEGKRCLVVELARAQAGLEDRLRSALAWAHVDAVRSIRAMPVDARHNAKIDYPALRRWLA